MKKTCIIIAGPTAVGKTAFAIATAKKYHTSIISADSRQCYAELSIGVARPSAEELAAVPHYFIASHHIQEEVTAAVFEKFALNKITELFCHHDVVVMVGGTGLYIRAFCEGLDEIPAATPIVRNKVTRMFEQGGIAELQSMVKKYDPVYFADGEIQNPRRLMRALEVYFQTGQSIRSFQKQEPVTRPFEIVIVGLEWPREVLYERINNRVSQMMADGLLDEVKSLLPYRNLKALDTVGYRELFDYFDGKQPLEKAVDMIRQNSRHYAKRQLTWFKKDPAMLWQSPANALPELG